MEDAIIGSNGVLRLPRPISPPPSPPWISPVPPDTDDEEESEDDAGSDAAVGPPPSPKSEAEPDQKETEEEKATEEEMRVCNVLLKDFLRCHRYLCKYNNTDTLVTEKAQASAHGCRRNS